MSPPAGRQLTVLAALLTLTAGSLTACGGGGEPATGVTRFIAEPPERPFERGTASRETTVFSWPLDDADALSRWNRVHLATTATGDGPARLTATSDDPYLWRAAGFPAAEVSTLRLVMEGFPQGDAKVFWRRSGEDFAEERSRTLVKPRLDGRGRQVFDFFVADHPLWRGEVEAVRLDPLSFAGSTFTLHRLEGVRETVDEGRLAQAAGTAWVVEVDHELRSALVAPPGRVHRRELSVPQGGRLRLGVGALELARGAAPAAVELRLDFQPASGPAEAVWHDRLRPGGRWLDLDLDLAAHAGRRGTLRLEVADATPGVVPVLADPRVVPRRQPGGGPTTAAAGRPDVILISIDTLRADRLSLYGHQTPTSPHLDRWAARHGVVFEQALAPAGGTLPSHTSMFTGHDSVRHGVRYVSSRVPEELTTLAESFRSQGYATAAFTGGVFLSPAFGLDQGFDRFRYWPEPGNAEAELRSHLEAALDFVRDPPSRPYFLFLHTYEVHDPYLPRAPHFAELGGEAARLRGDSVRVSRAPAAASRGFVPAFSLVWHDAESHRQRPVRDDEMDLVGTLYDAGVRYTDGLLAPLLERVTGPGTVVALTSDHGESLGEHGLFAHGNLSDETLHVPLVLAAPGRLPGGRRVDGPVRLVDVPPTLLELAGLPPSDATDGRSLVALAEGGADDAATASAEAHRDSWATSSIGVALRRPGRRPLAWNVTPWSPTGQAWSDPTDRRPIDPSAEERRSFERRLADDLPGLWIRLHNPGDEAWGFRLVGVDAVSERLGALGADCLRDSWIDGSPQFLVAAGCSCLLVLQGPADAELRIHFTDADGSVVARHTLDVGAGFDGTLGLERAGSSWPRVRRAPRVGLALSRRDWPPTAGRSVLSREEREDLRSLGYLD